MKLESIVHRAGKWLLVASLLSFGFAMAQAEPTMKEIYATAQAGKLDQAQVMIQQVLISHPNSAKAMFVQSELFARQGNLVRAREALASAEKQAPGLPFAKAESVQVLRAQLAAKSAAPVQHNVAPVQYAAPVSQSAPSSSSWGLPLLLAGGLIVAGYFIFRRRTPEPFAQPPVYANQGGMSGPQSFDMAGGSRPAGAMQAPYVQPGYAQQPGYGQPGYGQPAAGSGLGGRIMGGVATGLAVGAGVMAAEAIGRNLMGNHNQPASQASNFNNNDYQPIATNTDMGGQNFGVNDTNSWDDGGSSDSGSNDWDN
jgi:hypothetical protein